MLIDTTLYLFSKNSTVIIIGFLVIKIVEFGNYIYLDTLKQSMTKINFIM